MRYNTYYSGVSTQLDRVLTGLYTRDMKELNPRQIKILAAVVREYTKTALPVGSNILIQQYHFDVSSATLRNDMVHLENAGLLYQPHTSAGRIPTDTGYRYFVEKIMPERELSLREQQSLQTELLQLRAQNTRLTRSTAKLLSTVSGYVAVSGVPGRGDFSEFGLRRLMEGDIQDLDQLCQLTEALDYIDERCDGLLAELEDGETKIYIGKENPISKTDGYSMVVSQYDHDGEKGIVALIGPKNMKYEKNKSLINYVKTILGTSSNVGAVIMFINI